MACSLLSLRQCALASTLHACCHNLGSHTQVGSARLHMLLLLLLLCVPQLVAFAHDIVDDDEDFDEHLPFMAVEPRSKQKTTRRGGQRRRLREEDALEALHSLRNELEVS